MTDIFKKNKKELIILTLAAFAIYSVMITNELTNTYDGLWNGAYKISGWWENELGRFLIPLIDRAHSGMDAEPFISLVSLILFVLSDILIVDLLCPDRKSVRVFTGLLLITNTAVCISLSYKYTALVYAAAMFCSVSGAYFLDQVGFFPKNRKEFASEMAGILLIAASLACYQTYIGCTLLLLVFLSLKRKMTNVSGEERGTAKSLLLFPAKLVSVAVSCIVYYVTWNIVLHVTGLPKADYHSAADTSAGTILASFPRGVYHAYRNFIEYFIPGQNNINNIYQPCGLFAILAALAAVICCIAVLMVRDSFPEKAEAFVLLALTPLFANVSFVLAPGTDILVLQMSMPLALILPCVIAVTADLLAAVPDTRRKPAEALKWICVIISFVLFTGSFLMVSADQHEMRQTKDTSINFMNRVAADLEKYPEVYNGGTQAVFVGKPLDNPLCAKDGIYTFSNAYAHYGEFWTTGDCLRVSYRGLLRDVGVDLDLPDSAAEYQRVENLPEVSDMPAYPEEGYMKMIGGYCVIKVADSE